MQPNVLRIGPLCIISHLLLPVRRKFNIEESYIKVVDIDGCEIDDDSILQIPDYSSVFFT